MKNVKKKLYLFIECNNCWKWSKKKLNGILTSSFLLLPPNYWCCRLDTFFLLFTFDFDDNDDLFWMMTFGFYLSLLFSISCNNRRKTNFVVKEKSKQNDILIEATDAWKIIFEMVPAAFVAVIIKRDFIVPTST